MSKKGDLYKVEEQDFRKFNFKFNDVMRLNDDSCLTFFQLGLRQLF